MKFSPHSILWSVYYFLLCITTISGAAVRTDDGDVEEQGLYKKSDHVEILTRQNFPSKVYAQKHALLIQFYNSYCGHCRAFAPQYKEMALDISRWKNIVRLGVVDCSVEENNEICRQFEVMAYPTIKYFHENYIRGNENIGEKIAAETISKNKSRLIAKLQSEQQLGRLTSAPSLAIDSYATYSDVLTNVPSTIIYAFLVFENANSSLGSEVALDINEYKDIVVKRVYDTSDLAKLTGLSDFPSIVAVKSPWETYNITPLKKNEQSFLQAISSFLVAHNYQFPEQKLLVDDSKSVEQLNVVRRVTDSYDVVYYNDLEKTLKTSLHTEITSYKTLTGEGLQALLEFLTVIITNFPFKNQNLRDCIVALKTTLSTRDTWKGGEIYDTVKSLEESYAPVFATNLDYIGCKGSLPKYRGYSCGLWTLFHALTVNAVRKPGNEGPKVLRAMHGYIKHFFGCTECAQHFQAMAERNRIFDVKESDKAVLWLWVSHNEVNLRIAGDITEDPDHPKVQFPTLTNCPECRLDRGAWNLPAVYTYLLSMYAAENIRESRFARSAAVASSPFSNLDIGMLSLLYILSFVILILVIKYFLTKRFYRKRPYRHGRGKV